MTERSEGASEAQTLARRTGTVASFTLASRVLGYVRDAVMANLFGAGAAHDAYVAAHTIPNVLRRLVAEGTLMIAYVPLLAEEREKGGLAAMQRFTAAVLGALIPVLVLLVSLGMLFPEVAVTLFAPGFEADTADLAAQLTRVMMPFLFFISLVAVAGGALNTMGIFAPHAAAPIFLNLSIIGCVTAASGAFDAPITAAAWGVTFGGLAQLILQLPFLRRTGMWVRPRLELQHPGLRTLGRRMLPALFAMGVYQLNMVIIRQIASYMPSGQLTCYFVASRLQEFAIGVFAVSISVAALPTLSEHAARKDAEKVFGTFERAFRATTFITVPAMATLFVLADAIVGTLFRHGRFDAGNGALTAELVRILAFALVPVGTVRVLVPTYYAIGDTRTPVKAATASMLTTAGLGLALAPRLEIAGLTFAILAASAVQAVLLALWLGPELRARVGSAPRRALKGLVGHAIRCLAAALVGTLVTGYLASGRAWFEGDNVENALILGALVTFQGVAYLALAHGLGLTEGALILSALTRRLRRRR